MQSYFTNVKQTPYLDLVIKLMNSKDSFVNLRLMNFVALLIDLRDSRFIITSEWWHLIFNRNVLFLVPIPLQYCNYL